MDILPLHIEYLLTRHDCVIVPGIGAFIASENEAFIDFEKEVIYPRRREISFNSSVVSDDGLLSHSIARLEGLSYEDARRSLASLVERLNSDLNSEGEVSLGMVGRLIKDSEGKISFQPRISSTINDILPEIKLSAKNQTVADFEDPEVSDTDHDEQEDGVRIVRVPADKYVFTISKRAVHAAAMIVAILTLGLSLMIPINHVNEQKASVISIEEIFRHKVNESKEQNSDSIHTNIESNDSTATNHTSTGL